MNTYPTLRETLHREWGLVLFTTLMPSAIGVVLVGVLAGSPPEVSLTAIVLASLGLLTSIGHLARPLRSPFAIRHWTTSWLSREILAAVACFLLCIAWATSAWLGSNFTLLTGIACLLMAVILFFVMGRSYQIWTRPAWNGVEIFGELIAISLIAGIPAAELGLTMSDSSNETGWLGVGGLALGLAIAWWVTRYRLHRLEGLASERINAKETLLQRQKLQPYFRNMLLVGVIGLPAAFIAMTTSLEVAGWSVALASGLVSQLISRTLFYTMPVQRRYAVSFRPVKLHVNE